MVCARLLFTWKNYAGVCKAPPFNGGPDMRIDEGQRLILAVFGMLSEEETDAVLDFIDQLLAARSRGLSAASAQRRKPLESANGLTG